MNLSKVVLNQITLSLRNILLDPKWSGPTYLFYYLSSAAIKAHSQEYRVR